ncbi:MAG: hypothetical protein F4058_01680 [Rhodothermaceae bacterium]|nr:hypothetical protein [Rhodothermaceae bacterium]
MTGICSYPITQSDVSGILCTSIAYSTSYSRIVMLTGANASYHEAPLILGSDGKALAVLARRSAPYSGYFT